MKMNEVDAKWLKDNNACEPGYVWAVNHCYNLREVLETARPDWMRWTAARLLSKRSRVEWAWRCANSVRHSMEDKRSTDCLDGLRKWLDGELGDDELVALKNAADAAYAAAYAYAYAADAAYAAAYAADAAYAAAYAAAAAAYAAYAAADAAYAADAYAYADMRRWAIELYDAQIKDGVK